MHGLQALIRAAGLQGFADLGKSWMAAEGVQALGRAAEQPQLCPMCCCWINNLLIVIITYRCTNTNTLLSSLQKSKRLGIYNCYIVRTQHYIYIIEGPDARNIVFYQ